MQFHSVNEQVFFVTVRILAVAPREQSYGTGFFVGINAPNGKRRIFVVTAGHLPGSATHGEFYFLPANDQGQTLGTPLPYRWERSAWEFHPDPEVDVAVMPFERIDLEAADLVVGMSVISEEEFLPKWERYDDPMLEAIRRPQPITEVVVIGYPNNYFDRENGLPIARRGMTASPLSIDYERRPVFLIDSAVSPGSSGSPVFYPDTRSNPHKFKLLGLVSEVLPWKSLDWTPSPGEDRPLVNLGAVFKAHAIREAIEPLIGGPA